MRCVVRQWTARDGHERLLGHALIATHEDFVSKSSEMMEGRVYREHVAGREFLGVAIFDDSDEGPDRSDLRATLGRVTVEHAERATDPLRLDPLFDLTTIGQTAPHALAAVLVAAPGKAVALTGLLVGLACDIQNRLAPSRFLVARGAYAPSRFFVLLCSRTPIDVDWYVRSSLGREHLGAFRPLLSAPPRWYALDPVWHHSRRGDSARPAPPFQAARALRERAS